MIGTTSLTARIQARLIYPDADVPEREDFWAGAIAWALDSVNPEATIANPDRTSSYEIWYGEESPLKDLPFLASCFNKKPRLRNKWLPRGVSDFPPRTR